MAKSVDLEHRLMEIRGPAPGRSPNVRVLAAFAQNTDCRLAGLGFAAGVDFDQLLAGTEYQTAFGQSPFAIQRGLAFEELLRADGYARTFDLLRSPLGFPGGPLTAVDLRSGRGTMSERARVTANVLRVYLKGGPTTPQVLDGAVLPGTVGGLRAHFEADALALRGNDGMIHVAEVKSFPRLDDRVDPDKFGAALDQVAVYVHLAKELVTALGGDAERTVSERGLVITPRNFGLTPILSEQSVSTRVARFRQVLARIPTAADVVAGAPSGVTFGIVADETVIAQQRVDALNDLADRVGTTYRPGCLATCGCARFCRARAIRSGAPNVAGTAAAHLLPEVFTLGRAAALTRGAKATPVEQPAAEQLIRAGRLIDEAAAPTSASTTTVPNRRTP